MSLHCACCSACALVMVGVFEARVKIRHQHRRGFIIDAPEARKRAAGAGLDRHPRQPERGAVVSRGGLACAQSQQLHRLIPNLARTQQLLEVIQPQLVVEGQHESLPRVAVEMSVRCDMDNRVIRSARTPALKFLLLKSPFIRAFAAVHRRDVLRFLRHMIERRKALHALGDAHSRPDPRGPRAAASPASG